MHTYHGWRLDNRSKQEQKQNVAEQIFPTPANDLELEIIKLRKIISLQSNTIKEQQDVIKLLTHNE